MSSVKIMKMLWERAEKQRQVYSFLLGFIVSATILYGMLIAAKYYHDTYIEFYLIVNGCLLLMMGGLILVLRAHSRKHCDDIHNLYMEMKHEDNN